MSHIQNDKWLEAAHEHFQGAIDQGNYALAKAVIADTFDAGFPNEARQMALELRDLPISQFNQPSPYQNE
jgi:hypothetical protein